ncbi:pyridoxamine 5'-phosphate oxidase family protein [Granulicoccus sp. GXG6511]|uniref:pyridoxamine 5'-phosphate oxidase family protein n=1 Tax=Granulicoccus sp. GXG6511 TaxID=3381351 RepID=UPI003D7E8CF4
MENPGGMPGRFEALPESEVMALLRTHQIGRVAWEAAKGPVILPVAYAWSDGLIAFRTAAGSALAELATPTDVAFQIDEFDVETATGWSVLMSATTTRVTSPEEIVSWHDLLPEPWAPGGRDWVIRLTPRSISGRVVARA